VRAPTLIKDPSAVLDYGFDWRERGWLQEAETVIASSWSIPPALVEVTSGIEGGIKTVVWLSGGLVGQDYTITNQITTSAGRTDERSINLRMRER
jgi:hypothetical protein